MNKKIRISRQVRTSFLWLAGAFIAVNGATANLAALAQSNAPKVAFEEALSASVRQCISANETGGFDSAALQGAGFALSPYNDKEFRVLLNGAMDGQAFVVAFPNAGAEGCRIVTRYPELAPKITSSAIGQLKSAGYDVQGSGSRMTASKAGHALNVVSGKTQSTSIPFYQLSIEP